MNEGYRGLLSTAIVLLGRHTTAQIHTHSTGQENVGSPSIYTLSLHVADTRNKGTELAKWISDKITRHKGDGDELTNQPVV